MGIGHKIKEYRTEKGMTQKELADKLNVTFQAVSRWENNDVEPSFDCLRQMSEIFGCTINDLFEMNEKSEETEVAADAEEEKSEEAPIQIVERVIVQEAKPVLAVCECCNKPLYEPEEINRIDVKEGNVTRKTVYCKDCLTKHNKEQAQRKEEKRRADRRKHNADLDKQRKNSIVYPLLAFAVFLVLFIWRMAVGDYYVGTGLIVAGVLMFFFLACVFLDNNFVGEMWLEVAGWGVKRMPGIIWSFSLGGFIAMIVIKAILAVLAFLLGIACILLATALGMVVGVFVYPFAMAKNVRSLQ